MGNGYYRKKSEVCTVTSRLLIMSSGRVFQMCGTVYVKLC